MVTESRHEHGDNHLPLFWETDLDLARAQIVAQGRRFTAVAPELVDSIPTRSVPIGRDRPTRMKLLAPLAFLAGVAIFMVVRWPTTALPSLVVCLALMGVVVITAITQHTRALAQQRENHALRDALRRSQLAQNQLRFDGISEASRPAA